MKRKSCSGKFYYSRLPEYCVFAVFKYTEQLLRRLSDILAAKDTNMFTAA